MKLCGYCGRENEDAAAHCRECGTHSVDPDEVLSPSTPRDDEAGLSARSVTRILFLYLGVQFCVGVLVGFVEANFSGRHDGMFLKSGSMLESYSTIVGIGTTLCIAISGIVALFACHFRYREHLQDTGPTGAAWVGGSLSQNLHGLAAGFLTGCGYIILALLVGHSSEPQLAGPLARMSGTPGINRALWLFLVLVLAPAVEELFFRGVLFGGYRRSFGPARSAAITTGIFWTLHITEMIYYWPAMVGILVLALVALWFRLKSAAIGPAVAVHFGYNASMAVAVLWTATR